MEPAEARLFPGMLVDGDHNHVARNCAAFVSAAIPSAHDRPRFDARPLPATILPANKFFAPKILAGPFAIDGSYCDGRVSLRYIVSSYYLQFYINRTYHHMILGT
jgi:hypothetical protein